MSLLEYFLILLCTLLGGVVVVMLWLFYTTRHLNDRGESMEDDEWNN